MRTGAAGVSGREAVVVSGGGGGALAFAGGARGVSAVGGRSMRCFKMA